MGWVLGEPGALSPCGRPPGFGDRQCFCSEESPLLGGRYCSCELTGERWSHRSRGGSQTPSRPQLCPPLPGCEGAWAAYRSSRRCDAPASGGRRSQWSGGQAGCSERLLSDLDVQRALPSACGQGAPLPSPGGTPCRPLSPDLEVVRFLPQTPLGSLPFSSAPETVAHAPHSGSGGRAVMVPYCSHAKPLVACGGPFWTERLRMFTNRSGPQSGQVF